MVGDLQVSETLADRIVYHELEGFRLDEAGAANADRLWIGGGFPRSSLAPTEQASYVWRASFVRTFLERDIPNWECGSRRTPIFGIVCRAPAG
jgi:predicted AAA+ superfamily ATPase